MSAALSVAVEDTDEHREEDSSSWPERAAVEEEQSGSRQEEDSSEAGSSPSRATCRRKTGLMAKSFLYTGIYIFWRGGGGV
jgi:hypothetical protein